jgi:hypothetical protein
MEKYYKEHHPGKCLRRCIGAFNVEHRVYEVCCIEIVRVCPRCGCEHDHRQHRHCPHCGLNIQEHIHHKYMQPYGYGPEYGPGMYGYKAKKEIDPPEDDPPEDYDM